MLIDVLLLVASLGGILTACTLFTNGVEWLGHRLHMGEGAVGSLLAATGTVLPETLIPVVALVKGGDDVARHEVGIGAILGAPLMLATLAMFVTGAAVLTLHRTRARPLTLAVDSRAVRRDLTFFVLVYALAVGVSLLPHEQTAIRTAWVAALVAAYGIYVYKTLHRVQPATAVEALPALCFARGRLQPGRFLILFQTAVGLAGIIAGAELFVGACTAFARSVSLSPLILSLIVAPVATELPEQFNSVLWIRQGKDVLALGNITGAMVFQSTLPPALGIALTAWHLESRALLSAGLALAAATVLIAVLAVRRKLTAGALLAVGILYAGFLLALPWLGPG